MYIFYVGEVEMKYLLSKMKINGIKNIDKEIIIQFTNSTFKNIKECFQNSHVKAIYGTNGAGKTAIIQAINLYKNIILTNDYLALENANGGLSNLINQNNNKFSIELVFNCYDDKNKSDHYVYSHYISLEKRDGSFKIVEEILKLLSGKNNNMDDKYKIICHAEEGKIINLNICNETKINENLKMSTMNLLWNNSFISLIIKNIVNVINNINDIDKFIHFLLVYGFSQSLVIVFQDSDLNYIDFYSVSNQIDSIRKYEKNIKDVDIFQTLLSSNMLLKQNTRKIHKKNYEKYQKTIKQLTAFIKVFKEELENIDIKKDENGDFYECELILEYKDGRRINEKYESTGIKKIIYLYNALCDIEKGKIVFIDEFDSNIHDVLLMKLLEYIVEYTKGQFIFTTHNLEPMEILKKRSHAIDFLSTDSRITSWARNGNYSPSKLYRNGLISYSPFNIEPFNFLGVFEENEHD